MKTITSSPPKTPWPALADTLTSLRWLCCCLALLTATSTQPARAALPPPIDPTLGFELDGDVNQTTSLPDWCIGGSPLTAGGSVSIYSAVQDGIGKSVFTTGGSKDTLGISSWRWKDGSVPPKDDIMNVAVALVTVSGHQVLYFRADLAAPNGDAALGIWLFHDKISLNPDGTFSGVHTDGDVLLVAHFTNGGSVADIVKYVWVGGALTGPFDLVPEAVAFVNTNTLSPCYDPTLTLAPTQFLEGGVDLSALFGDTFSPCVSSFLFETRSSQVTGAQLKDFVLGELAIAPSVAVTAGAACEGSTVTVSAAVTGGLGTPQFAWTVPAGAVNPGDVASFQASVSGLYTVVVTGGQCTSEPASATVTITPLPPCSIAGSDGPVCPGSDTVYTGSEGGIWTISGNGTIKSVSGITVTVTAANSCDVSFTLTNTVTVGSCTAVCTKTVLVNDTIPPVVSCPADQQLQCGSPTAPANTGSATATDNCGTATVTFTDAATPPNCTSKAGIDRTWKATDACGNTATCVQHIVFVDTTAPVISALPAPTTAQCPATPLFATPTATDACDASPTLTFADVTTPGSCAQNQDVTRIWTATDHCGNSSTASQIVHVVDTTAPTITCAAPTTIQCPATPNFPPPTVRDLCDANPTVSFADVTTPGGCAQAYSVTRTWTATDLCGNQATCSQSITVSDTTPPTVSCPGNIVICDPNVVSLCPTATDNCDPAPSVTCTRSDAKTLNEPYPVGTTTISVVATDQCGNSSAPCTFTVVVEEQPRVTIEPPDAVCAGELISALAVTSGTGPFTFSWVLSSGGTVIALPAGSVVMTIDDLVPGQCTLTIDTAAVGLGSGSYDLILYVSGVCGATSVGTIFTINECGPFCTLTQGFYGNLKGKFMGVPGSTVVYDLLHTNGPIVLGKPGQSLTITEADVTCLVSRMPAGGAPTTLTPGNHVFGANCSMDLPLDKQGLKFRNVFLGQVIALNLNVRLDTHDLIDWILPSTVVCIEGGGSISFDATILNALDTLGLPRTTGGLIELANRALGGWDTAGASIDSISNAVSKLNEAFDGCREIIPCTL